MTQHPPASGVEAFLDKLSQASSERAQRQAVTALTNYYFELSQTQSQRLARETNLIVEALIRTLEEKDRFAKARMAAVRSLGRIVGDLSKDRAYSGAVDLALQSIGAVARRRTDDPAVVEAAREVANSCVSANQSTDDDTQVACDTTAEICPLFKAIAQHQPLLAQTHDQLAQAVTEVLKTATHYRPLAFDEGIEIAQRINSLARQYGLELFAPDNPQSPVTLGFRQLGGSKSGVFILRVGTASRYAGVGVPELMARGAKS